MSDHTAASARWALVYELNAPTAEVHRAILAAHGPAGLLDFAADQCADVLTDFGPATTLAAVVAAVDALAELARLPGFLNLIAWTPGAEWPGVAFDAHEASAADTDDTGAALLAFLARVVVPDLADAAREGVPVPAVARGHLLNAIADADRIRAALAPFLDRIRAGSATGYRAAKVREAGPLARCGRRISEARRVAALVLRGRYLAAHRLVLERLAKPAGKPTKARAVTRPAGLQGLAREVAETTGAVCAAAVVAHGGGNQHAS